MARIIIKQNQTGGIIWSVLDIKGNTLAVSPEQENRSAALRAIAQFSDVWPEASLNIIDQTPEGKIARQKAS